MKALQTAIGGAPRLVGFLAAVLTIGWASWVAAGVVLPSPNLPPEPDPPNCAKIVSLYQGAGVHVIFPGPIDLSDPIHMCFQNVTRQDDGQGNELETFDSVLLGKVDVGGGPAPITLTGPVTTKVFGKIGNTTGTFDTEIVSMSLSGNFGGMSIVIRESPTLSSVGQTKITDLGGGQWLIDSFFDVFTELSIDGGPFIPQTSPAGHMELVPVGTVPVEPVTWGQMKARFQ